MAIGQVLVEAAGVKLRKRVKTRKLLTTKSAPARKESPRVAWPVSTNRDPVELPTNKQKLAYR
jgi:hypothetical protein